MPVLELTNQTSGSINTDELRLVFTFADKISRLESNAAFEDLMDLRIQLFPFEGLQQRCWALRHTVTLYDGWYVALAEAIKAPLATLDRRLTDAPGPTCGYLVP